MVLLSGEAGIGKTRLAEELCAWVERQGAAVAAAHCYPAGGIAVAYAPVVEWLNDGDIRARMAGLGDVWLAEIARIYPALLADHPRLKSPGPLTEPWQRTRLFEALARAVLGPGERAPLLLFLDDLQWCDQETLDWLGYLLRFDAKAPVLVVSTVRKYEIDSVHPLMAFWFALTRSGLLFEIPLGPLDAAETGLLAASVAGRMVDGDETARIYQDTEGNPLFVVEMVQTERPDAQQALPAALLYPSPGAAFPPKVRAVIQWRLAQLTSPARALAQTAAVIGRRFRLEVLARASGLDEDAVAGGLEELWRRHIVRVQSSSEYDFSHDGIRAVVYDEIAPFRRRAAHLRVAQALEELHHADLDAASIPIAGHYEQAGQLQPAIRFYLRAASVAESVYANAQAARLYQHLLESELSAGLTRPEACGVMLALGEVWIATGQWAQAETTIRKALAAALALNDAPLAARAKCALADVLHLLGYYDAALRWLEEAQSAFRAAGDERGEAGALRIAGEIHWRRGDHARALAALEQQQEMAVGMGDPYGMCQAQEAIGMVLWSQGDWERAADSCLKAIRTAEPLEYKPILTRASITLGNISSGEHRHAEAVAWYQRAGALARESDDRQALCWVTYYIAQILATYGDDARARAGYLRSLRSALEIGDRLSACLNVAGLAEVVERLGSAGSAESLYRLAIELGLRLNISGYLTGVLVRQARLLLGQGRAGDARDVYQQALAQMAGVAADPLAGEDTRFDAQVLGIHLRRALGECSPVESAAELRALLLRAGAQSSQAALYDALWQLAPEAEDARAAAAALYRAEYAVTWARKYRQRYEALAGEPLPNPPPLPDVSDLIPDPPENPDLEPILAQIRSSFE
jgi:tetratricopeptide (TPR) repeat protein